MSYGWRPKPRSRIREAFSREKSFRGADIEIARKAAKVGWVLAISVAYGLLAFYPPTARLGETGWAVFGGVSLVNVAWLYYLFRHNERVSFNSLLLGAYLGVAATAAAQWLAGGVPAPYHQLYPFMICGAAGIHPPRRFLPFMVVLSVAAIVPEVGRASTAQLGDLVTELVLWLGASLFVLGLMWKLRQHRADLQSDEAEARELARVDTLTGLGNRRAYEETLRGEISRSSRSGAPLSLLVCDLNGLKEINDRYGHLAGDDCLRQAAAALKAVMRLEDRVFRWGGDEFAVVVPDMDAGGAAEVGERLEELVQRDCSRPDGSPLRITSGHATLRDGMTGQELLATGDLALRERKRARFAGHARAS